MRLQSFELLRFFASGTTVAFEHAQLVPTDRIGG